MLSISSGDENGFTNFECAPKRISQPQNRRGGAFKVEIQDKSLKKETRIKYRFSLNIYQHTC